LDVYQQFIATRTYTRWLEEENRRETFQEAIDRYVDFFSERIPDEYIGEFHEASKLISSLDVMPSMRCLWTAGEALARENIAGYNCSYLVINNYRAFAEMLYILMNGTGVGFSTERQEINKLPIIPNSLKESDKYNIVFSDSKRGWAEGYLSLLKSLYQGFIPASIDYSRIRPEGARLKTFGGRASGPRPLKELVTFTINMFKNAQGRKLSSLECYDLGCFIANCVVVGGVRRSATINLSNLSDDKMRHAKDGHFYLEHPYRALSNNSVAYTEKPNSVIFMDEWLSLVRGCSGERGIVNREAFDKKCTAIGREVVEGMGVNPCGEIILRPNQFCNLSEVVIKEHDNFDTLLPKVEAATIFGILQSTLTKFNFIRKEWIDNTEEERLLGVSLTGICDNNQLGPGDYRALRDYAWRVAEKWADRLSINCPKAITCVKPSGTVSQLVNSASGIHPRYSKYYIRRVRVNATDPIANYLIDKGVTWNPEVGQLLENHTTKVFDFPIASPEGCVTRNDMSSIDQLEHWRELADNWCDHNPSATIYVKDDEWVEVGAWVYRNWEYIGGLSFLPYASGNYPLAPYEEISYDEYERLKREFPKDIDFERDLPNFEKSDETEGAREFACIGGVCEI
jgi:ribonucleoside-diphosphate reductase alpha chain